MSIHLSDGARAAPLATSAWGDPSHSVQFYADDAMLVDEVSHFIDAALEAGAAAVILATADHREGLAQRLLARGVDLAQAAAQGRYLILDAAAMLSTFMVDGSPDAARFDDVIGGALKHASANGTREPVGVFGEMVALLWAGGMPQAAIQLEHLWNELARSYAFSLRCAYPLSAFPRPEDGAILEQICAAHTSVVPAESYRALSTEEERLRAIARLQQQAQALETEIEERRRVEQALRERNQELREAVATRDAFLSMAAHELKTPVTGLRGFAQLLLRDVRQQRAIAPERLAAALDVIDVQTERLRQLVARMLDTAYIGDGKLRVEPVRVDLVTIVRAALAQRRDRTTHALVYTGPAQLAAEIDPARFGQVITNLLDNAVKFSPDGGTVTVELGQEDDGGIRLAVADEGVGISPEQRTQIFDRFHQAHSESHLSGLGLGLYIAREIVELHEGIIWCEAPEHGGSRFVVVLPPRPA